jgi:chemotaxis protein histidine kinase CheA
VERAVHHDLAKSRHRQDREFFKISPDEAVKAVQRRANENISQHPGWPDLASVQSLIDKAALQKKQEEDELEQRARLEAAQKEQQRQRETEAARIWAEQKRIAAASKKQEEEEKELARRKERIDKETRATLSEGAFGQGTAMACCAFGLLCFKAPILIIPTFAVIFGWAIWIDRGRKKNAIALRQQWNLPSVGVSAKAALPPPPSAKESRLSSPTDIASRISAGCVPSVASEQPQHKLSATPPLKLQPAAQMDHASEAKGCATALSSLTIMGAVFFVLAIIAGSFSNKSTPPPRVDQPANNDNQEGIPTQGLVEPARKESLPIRAPQYIDPAPSATEMRQPMRHNQKAQPPPKQQRQTHASRRNRAKPKTAKRDGGPQQQAIPQALPPAQYQPPTNEAAQQWMRGYRPNTEIKVWTHGVNGWKQETP